MRVFLKEISIWVGELSKAVGPLQYGWTWSNLLRAWIKQKVRERLKLFCLIVALGHWYSSVLGTLGSQAFRLGSAPSAGCQAFELHHNFLGSVAYRWQIVGLLSLHNYISQNLIINLFYLYINYQFCFSSGPWLIQTHWAFCWDSGGTMPEELARNRTCIIKYWNLIHNQISHSLD